MLTKYSSLSRKLPKFLYKTLAQSYIDYNFPRHIFVELTANCNLSCEYCPREKRKEDIDFGLFTSIIDEASQYGARSFSLHLFGEPLLYSKILDAIRYIKSKNKRHTILLTTNGTLLNKYSKDLVDLGVDRIIWSWRRNNFNAETIRVLKKIGMIRLLIEETPKDEFERWSKFPRVEVKHLHNYGGNIDVKKWGIDDVLPERYPCYHLWLAPAVRWNGEIVECCNIPASGTEVLGRYPDDTISDVWNGEGLKKLRDSHLKGIYPGACGKCTSWQAYPNIFFRSQCQSA